MKFAIPIGFVL